MSIQRTIQELQKKVDPAVLVVVTKSRSRQEIEDVIKSGVLHIAENKLQEIERKYDHKFFHRMTQKGVKLHFVGHLQKNKVKKIVRYCDVLQSVDSLSIVQKIDAEAAALKKCIPIFVQLNLTEEPQKFGIQQKELGSFLKKLSLLSHVKLQGLMCMGKSGDLEETRKVFRKCRLLADQHGIREVSMGMSEDYQIAGEEGSTMVRLGDVIFHEDLRR